MIDNVSDVQYPTRVFKIIFKNDVPVCYLYKQKVLGIMLADKHQNGIYLYRTHFKVKCGVYSPYSSWLKNGNTNYHGLEL